MIELLSKTDIDKISLNILKGSKAWGKLPTPVDSIVEYSELVVNSSIDISKVHESYIQKAPRALFKALEKVRGLFDRKKKLIYLDLSQLPTRKNFVKLHETGHGVLPWQQGIHEVLEDDDDSLSAYVNEEFETEANYFASVTLFQHDRFLEEVRKLNLGIDSAMHLSKLFGASVHATLRTYVEKSSKRCALIVLDKMKSSDMLTLSVAQRNYFQSNSFSKAFGTLTMPESFDLSWPFTKEMLSRRRGIIKGQMVINTWGGNEEFNYQFFYNSYNGFVFVYPVGEKQSSKTQIIISNENDTF